ncbi:hypothetical protein C8J57DRAFT_1469324 [Mycena rebaudengoi]|nr:hypothetical protein C8J57DRAFT_1469324 [Mycena rebaudengoi]
MGKSASSSSSPRKSPKKSPKKEKQIAEPVDETLWRHSTKVSPTSTISKTLAKDLYRVRYSDLEGLAVTESESVVKIKGKNTIVPMLLYSEQDVEFAAWRRRGGPENFQKCLDTLRERYQKQHPGKEFPEPDAYQRSSAEGSVRLMRLPSSSKALLPDPRAARIKAGSGTLEMRPLERHYYSYTQSAKDEAFIALFNTADSYPPRPTLTPPSSSSFDLLRDVLSRAASLNDATTREQLEVYDSYDGYSFHFWNEAYMTELFTALAAVITEHGLGDAGWKSARWEVYDTGLEYSAGSWNDDAKDWLMGRMQLISNCITTRQDNKSEADGLCMAGKNERNSSFQVAKEGKDLEPTQTRTAESSTEKLSPDKSKKEPPEESTNSAKKVDYNKLHTSFKGILRTREASKADTSGTVSVETEKPFHGRDGRVLRAVLRREKSSTARDGYPCHGCRGTVTTATGGRLITRPAAIVSNFHSLILATSILANGRTPNRTGTSGLLCWDHRKKVDPVPEERCEIADAPHKQRKQASENEDKKRAARSEIDRHTGVSVPTYAKEKKREKRRCDTRGRCNSRDASCYPRPPAPGCGEDSSSRAPSCTAAQLLLPRLTGSPPSPGASPRVPGAGGRRIPRGPMITGGDKTKEGERGRRGEEDGSGIGDREQGDEGVDVRGEKGHRRWRWLRRKNGTERGKEWINGVEEGGGDGRQDINEGQIARWVDEKSASCRSRAARAGRKCSSEGQSSNESERTRLSVHLVGTRGINRRRAASARLEVYAALANDGYAELLRDGVSDIDEGPRSSAPGVSPPPHPEAERARAGAVDRSHAHIPHRPAARAPQRAKAYPTFPPRPLRAHPSCVAAHASPPTPQSYAVRSPIARTPTSHMALRIPAAREHNENGGQSGVARATGVRTCCMGPIRCTEQDTCVPAAPSAPPHTTTLAHRRIPATRKWRERLEVPKEERTAGRRRACAVVGVLKRTVGAGAPWWAAGRRRGTTKAWRRSPDTAQSPQRLGQRTKRDWSSGECRMLSLRNHHIELVVRVAWNDVRIGQSARWVTRVTLFDVPLRLFSSSSAPSHLFGPLLTRNLTGKKRQEGARSANELLSTELRDILALTYPNPGRKAQDFPPTQRELSGRKKAGGRKRCGYSTNATDRLQTICMHNGGSTELVIFPPGRPERRRA